MNVKKKIIMGWLGGVGFQPSDISSLQFWMDWNYSSNMTRSSDFNQNLDSIIDRKAGYSAAAVSVTGSRTGSYNGQACYFNGVLGTQSAPYYRIASSQANFKYLHNGTGMTMYVIFKIIDANPNAQYTILGNVDLASSGVGIQIEFDDRAASSRSNGLTIQIAKGTAGTNLYFNNALNDVVVPQVYNILEITENGSNIVVNIWNETTETWTQIWTAAKTGTPSAANSTQDMYLGARSGGTIWYKGYQKQAVFFNAVLSGTDQTNVRNWAIAEVDRRTTSNMNIYLLSGQSNADGRADNADIDPDLDQGPIGSYMWNAATTPSSEQRWQNLELGVNNTSENLGTDHGPQMRFSKGINSIQSMGLIQFALGSSPLKQVAGGVEDWNIASANERYVKWKDSVLTPSLYDLIHRFGITPVIRGLIWMQGESDATLAIAGGSVYQANLENLLEAILDHLSVTLGYDTSKCRVTVLRIQNQYALYDPTNLAAVRLAQDNYDISGYIPVKAKSQRTVSTDTYDLQGDLLHYDAVGIEEMADELVSYYTPFVNE